MLRNGWEWIGWQIKFQAKRFDSRQTGGWLDRGRTVERAKDGEEITNREGIPLFLSKKKECEEEMEV